MSKTVNHLISRFIHDMQWDPLPGEEQRTAFNRCWEMSLAFKAFCLGAKADVCLLHCEGLAKPFVPPADKSFRLLMPQLQMHWIVWFPRLDVGVDWTARQFWPDADHPLILPNRQAVAELWHGIEWPPTSTRYQQRKRRS